MISFEVYREFKDGSSRCEEMKAEPGAEVRLGIYGDETDLKLQIRGLDLDWKPAIAASGISLIITEVPDEGLELVSTFEIRNKARREAFEIIERIFKTRSAMAVTESLARGPREDIIGLRAAAMQSIAIETNEAGNPLYSNEAARLAAVETALNGSEEYRDAQGAAAGFETVLRQFSREIEADLERVKVLRAFLHGS